jgi:YVTN family beta-propeller protein
MAGAEYVYIGNGQIDRMNARTIDSAGMQPVRMYRVPLRPRAAGVVAVALSGRDSVALFDAETLDRLATLPAGNDPHEIADSPDGRRAYVANAHDTTISVLDISTTPRVAATWFLPDSIRVHDVAVSGDGGTVWAASGERRVVLELEAVSGRVRRRFPIERAGGWMLETGGPDGTLVIANLEGGAVTLLAPATGRQTVFPGREGEIDAAATRDGREIWAVNFMNDTLTVFDGRSGSILGKQRSGTRSGRVIFTPDGRRALTVNGGDSTLVAFDVGSRRPVATLTVAGGPKVIALSRDGRRAYVTHPERGMLTMIDVPSMTVLRSVPVPGTPDGVAVLEAP